MAAYIAALKNITGTNFGFYLRLASILKTVGTVGHILLRQYTLYARVLLKYDAEHWPTLLSYENSDMICIINIDITPWGQTEGGVCLENIMFGWGLI